MARTLSAAILITLALASVPSCSTAPQWTVTGVWVNSPIRTDSTVRLVLRQSGQSIIGEACSDVGSTLLWTAASVEGQFPDFRFVVRLENVASCCQGPGQLESKVFDRDSIFLYYVINGQLVPKQELHRSADQQYQCPSVDALR